MLSVLHVQGILLRGEEWNGVVSLGLPCTSDKQCRASDPASRCIGGVCDCLVRSNLTYGCSAMNRGCHTGTFQVIVHKSVVTINYIDL